VHRADATVDPESHLLVRGGDLDDVDGEPGLGEPTSLEREIQRCVGRAGEDGDPEGLRGHGSLHRLSKPRAAVIHHGLSSDVCICRLLCSISKVSSARRSAGGGAERGAQPRDDRPADGDRDERAREARPEGDRPQRRERSQLDRHHRHRHGDRGVVIGDQERKRVEDATQERPEPGDGAADDRVAASGQVAGVRQAL
jgi:hypothetical protein